MLLQVVPKDDAMEKLTAVVVARKGALEELMRERIDMIIQASSMRNRWPRWVRHYRSEAVRFESGIGMVSARER